MSQKKYPMIFVVGYVWCTVIGGVHEHRERSDDACCMRYHQPLYRKDRQVRVSDYLTADYCATDETT